LKGRRTSRGPRARDTAAEGVRPARVAPLADPAEAVERVLSRRQLLIQDGDVVLSREPADRRLLGTATTWRYRLHVHPDAVGGKLSTVFAHYDLAAMAGEELAVTRHVRLFYEEDGALTLLKDYRPA
jgi:hypothetical protein